MTKCAQCGMAFASGDYDGLSSHLYYLAQQSDPGHVMWLNRNITKRKADPKKLSGLLADYFDTRDIELRKWIKRRFIEKFYGPKPHPFVLALQHPSRAT
ncbi:MAG: C2H2 type zinc finger domain-containing protein, partial [Candidatus Geothermarchaeales archaeon]